MGVKEVPSKIVTTVKEKPAVGVAGIAGLLGLGIGVWWYTRPKCSLEYPELCKTEEECAGKGYWYNPKDYCIVETEEGVYVPEGTQCNRYPPPCDCCHQWCLEKCTSRETCIAAGGIWDEENQRCVAREDTTTPREAKLTPTFKAEKYTLAPTAELTKVRAKGIEYAFTPTSVFPVSFKEFKYALSPEASYPIKIRTEDYTLSPEASYLLATRKEEYSLAPDATLPISSTISPGTQEVSNADFTVSLNVYMELCKRYLVPTKNNVLFKATGDYAGSTDLPLTCIKFTIDAYEYETDTNGQCWLTYKTGHYTQKFTIPEQWMYENCYGTRYKIPNDVSKIVTLDIYLQPFGSDTTDTTKQADLSPNTEYTITPAGAKPTKIVVRVTGGGWGADYYIAVGGTQVYPKSGKVGIGSGTNYIDITGACWACWDEYGSTTLKVGGYNLSKVEFYANQTIHVS